MDFLYNEEEENTKICRNWVGWDIFKRDVEDIEDVGDWPRKEDHKWY